MHVAPLLVQILLLGMGSSSQDTPADWAQVWSKFYELRRLAPTSREARSLAGEIELLVAEDTATERLRLLAAQLNRYFGEAPGGALVLGERVPWPFEGRENFLAAEVMAASSERAFAILEGLTGLGAALSRDELLTAWNVGVEDARALRLEDALAIQHRLHELFPAPWSAYDLALTLTLSNRAEEADRVLAACIEAEVAHGSPTGELWSRRGIAALGLGNDRLARDYLGRALSLGSKDAALVLAKLDLDQGDPVAARHGFRVLVASADASDWALRGWGMSFLAPLPTTSFQ